MILETQALTRRFGSLTAVDAVTLSVTPGEVFGLLGPNGAGKTTTIKMLITLLPPTSGAAKVAGFDIVHDADNVRRAIGYVSQMISVDASLTGFENLLIFAKLYDIPRKERETRVSEALSFFGLSEVAGKLVREFSGGMIRRLEVAQSTLHRPRLLFLDEPTGGLDPIARKAVWEHIEHLRSDFGTTIFLTTHYMEEADTLCNRVAIMHRGKIVIEDSPRRLKESIGRREATLGDVFVYYAGDTLDSGGSYIETSRGRRASRRLA
ncbi:MAG TPA: ATP-binding cassette domain-containing protein [Blastocatellia bacterium]|nr:ATP-binding cassette domain-containing protein [Blastocatellia bacterium]